MVARLNNITFACAEPVELAEFWRQALGYEHIETPPEILARSQKIDRTRRVSGARGQD